MGKYKCLKETIPQEARKELNEKILFLLESNSTEQAGITHEDIFNAYTGDGGLHGLFRSDYENYYEFSEAKKEVENGQFFTPPSLCQAVMESLDIERDALWADLTCGSGNFFNYAPVEGNAYGCELDKKAHKVASFLYPEATLKLGDIRDYNPGVKFQYIVGNPPFNLHWEIGRKDTILSQLFFCQKAAELLQPLGIMAIIVPQSFLSDDFSDRKMIADMEERFSFLGQMALDENAFSYLGVKGYKTKVQFWQKRSDVKGWMPQPYTTKEDAACIQTNIKEAKSLMKKNREQILHALAKEKETSDNFQYQAKKYLFAIKSHPKLQGYYGKCCEELTKFYTQKQPEGMSYEEWVKVRLTEKKVLAYLRATVKKQQSKVLRDEVKLVKTDYGLTYKAYSPKAKKQMACWMKPQPLYEIIADDDVFLSENEEGYREDYGSFCKLLRRKRREFEREQMPFKDMTLDADIAAWLDGQFFFDKENEETIQPNNIQKHDLNLVLQKRYALLQWAQGSGKTIAGILSGKYRMEKQGAYCTFVISPAISIRNNWDVVLPNFGIHYIMVEKLSDFGKIQRGDFVIATLNMVVKYKKQLKAWVKAHNQNIALCFDESDEMSNPSSKRTKAVLACFRKARYKLLMTGTSTRNNISEFAPQLELLYNNSVNSISWCKRITKHERPTKKNGLTEAGLVESHNPYYGIPIPAYKKGYALFSASHLPEKPTVFGVGQKGQDIYNADVLSDILGRLVITRTFEEVVGKNITKIHQVPVSFVLSEREVYQKAMDEFSMMRGSYFASTGNSRKDAMMRLIQQITLLLRISAAPNTVKEYCGGMPTKIKKVLELVESHPEEVVAIGVRHKIVVDVYEEAIRAAFPTRPLFVVTGSTTTLAKRRKLRKTLKESGNGILLCTQQSLPSSVNFEFVDTVVIPELHYNNAQMSQFYHRFIRYTSTNEKNIYFVTYAGSIESNQMAMVLAKEKLNMFMKGQDTDLDDIYEQFGVDYNLLGVLLRKESDEEGHFQIRWGEQIIA